MIINPKAEQNQRQRKIQKSRMYKQMLDNQILGNERYKKQHAQKTWDNNDSFLSAQTHFMPVIERKKTQNLESSFVYQAGMHKLPSKKVNLPALTDKNTLYRGSSRFIKVDEPSSVHKNKKRHVQTELIEEEQSDDDQYNSTCEKIIQELQSIIRDPIKQKYRKRYNQFSENSHYKRNPNKNKSIDLYETEQKKENKQEDEKAHCINPQNKPNNLYGKHKTEKRSISENVNEFEEDYDIQNQGSVKQVPPQVKNVEKHKVQLKQGPIDNAAKQKYIKSENNKLANNNKIDKQQFKETISFQKEPVGYQSLSTKQQQYNFKGALNSQRQRQKFLQVLRKVKTRGESLFLKVSKLPTTKNFEQSD